MADPLVEARQTVSEARQTADIERQNNAQAREQINKTLSQLRSEQVIRKSKGLAGLRQRQLVEGQVGIAQDNLTQREAAVEQFTEEVGRVEGQIQEADAVQKDYNDALRAFQSNEGGAVFTLENERSREFYRQLQNNKENAVQATIDNLKAQGVTDTATLNEVKTELQVNLGKVGTSRLNQRINTIVNNAPQFQTLELPTVTETKEIQSFSTVKADRIDPVSNFSTVPNTVNAPSRFQRFQGILRGQDVKVPGATVIAETLFTGRSGDELLGQVKPSEVIQAPLKAVSTFSTIAGEAAEAGAKKLGITGIKTEIPAFDVALRQTRVDGLELSRGGTIIPALTVSSLNPKQIGTLTRAGTFGVVSGANAPILFATSAGAVSQGFYGTFDKTRTVPQRVASAAETVLGLYGVKVSALNPAFRVRPTVQAGGAGGVSKYSIFGRNGEEFIITQADKTNTFEFIKPFKSPDGKQLTSSSFFIRRDLPPVVEYSQGSAFFRPIETIKTAPRAELISSRNILSDASTGAIINNPTFFGKGRDLGGGNPSAVVGKLGGGSVPVRSIRELPPEQQEAFLDLFQQRTGRPISVDTFEKTFANTKIEKSTGGINAEILSSLPDKTQVGKRITRSATSMETTPMISNEAAPFDVFKTRLGGKDVTLPSQLDDVPTQTSSAQGVSVVFKEVEPVVDDFISGQSVLKKPKTVQSKKVIETLKTAQAAAIDLIPRPTTPSAPVSLDIKAVKPIIPGKTSTFNQLDVKQEVVSQKTLPSIKAESLNKVGSATVQQPRQISLSALSLGLKTGQKNTQNTVTKINTSTRQIPKIAQIGLQTPKLVQSQNARLKVFQSTQPKQRTPTGKTPRPPVIAKLLGTLDSFGQGKSLEGFEVFVRKNRQDVSIGEASTIGQAGSKLIGELKGSLRASGFVVDKATGSRVSLDKLGNLGREFGSSKRDSSRLVQRRGFRLGTRSEVTEIKASKRGKQSLKRFKLFG